MQLALVAMYILYIISQINPCDCYFQMPRFRRRHKNMLISAIVGGSAAMKLMKPKKGILPVPLPIPIPLPIEWEQPPVVIHPKKEIVAVPSIDDRSEDKKKISSTTTTTTTTEKPQIDEEDDEW